ncbi:MAG: type II toxin-antitoxin system Phd/YefM family antitoxin [Anaerolineales bacterium]
MEKKIGLAQARKEFSKVINAVQYQGESFIISRHGEEAAAVVPLQVYQNWIEGREIFFNSIREIQSASNLDQQQAKKLAEEAVAHARKSRK